MSQYTSDYVYITGKFKIEVNTENLFLFLNTKGNIKHLLHELIFTQLMPTQRSSKEHN